MIDTERAALQSQIDQVVVLETVQGDRLLAKILFVFDEGETPDLFCVEVEPRPTGDYIEKGTAGHSILLSDILTVKSPA
ncbi:MAG TPA: hypothetical protein VK578_04570 [Edaphobacter sp.]|jgi:hypothetical protein|nr:hypothetical protein [Edaphobacter sp.]